MSKQTQQPRILSWFFHHLLPYDPYGSARADIDEVYYEIVDESGRSRANAWYFGQIIRSIPAAILNSLYWASLMSRHYATATFRNFKRNSLTTALNLMGLSAAVGATIVMFLFIDLQLNMDSFHENLDDIYLIEYEAIVGDSIQEWGNSPLPLGPAVEANDPDVLHAVRMARANAAVRYDDVIFDERLRFVDRNFFEVFSFPILSGSDAAFRDGTGVVLSEQTATKFFGEQNAVGEELFLTLSNGKVVGVTVSGVAEKAPMASSFRFNVLVPIELMSEMGVDFDDWGAFTNGTFLHLMPNSSSGAVISRLETYLPIVRAANDDRTILKLMIEPLADVPSRSSRLMQSPLASVFPVAYLLFGMISLMVLLVACFNYVNIAIATAMRRSKEIGIRKVVGSYRIQLIVQFLGENLILSLGALAAGIVLAEFFFIPYINSTQDGLTFQLHYLENRLLWSFLLGVLGIAGIGAGLYPALFVSRFQPSKVLCGTLAVAGKRRLTRVMLSTQLVFSFLLLAFGAVMLQNAEHQRQIDWGYDQEQRIVVPFTAATDLRAFQHEIEAIPGVIQTASSTEHIGRGAQPAAYSFDGREYQAEQMGIGFGYLETMTVRLKSGRFFEIDRGLDATSAVVINSKLESQLGLEEGESALGKMIQLDGEDLEIVGITEDFYNTAFILGIDPLLFRISDAEYHRFLAVQVAIGSGVEMGTILSNEWKAQSPELPYNGFYQDEIFDQYFESMDGSAKIFLFISAIALVISVMGLFGLVLITVTRRGREIGIRKTLGASVWSIIRVMQRETVNVSVFALVIGAPLSYFAISALFNGLNPESLGADSAFVMKVAYLIGPVAIVLGATIFSSVAGAFRGARSKPVDILRKNAD